MRAVVLAMVGLVFFSRAWGAEGNDLLTPYLFELSNAAGKLDGVTAGCDGLFNQQQSSRGKTHVAGEMQGYDPDTQTTAMSSYEFALALNTMNGEFIVRMAEIDGRGDGMRKCIAAVKEAELEYNAKRDRYQDAKLQVSLNK